MYLEERWFLIVTPMEIKMITIERDIMENDKIAR